MLDVGTQPLGACAKYVRRCWPPSNGGQAGKTQPAMPHHVRRVVRGARLVQHGHGRCRFSSGPRVGLGHSKHAFGQQHAGDGIEKALLTMILVPRGAPELMIDAREGPPLPSAACCSVRHRGRPLEALCLLGLMNARSQQRQRYAFWTRILDAEGAPVLMSNASEGQPLQNASCCISPRPSGHLEYLAICA